MRRRLSGPEGHQRHRRHLRHHGIDSIDSIDGIDGIDGTNGIDGIDGTNGIDGIDGIDGTDAQFSTYLVKNQFQIPAGDGNVDGTAACHAGDQVLSGGYSSNDHTNHWSKVYQNRMTWVNTRQREHPGRLVLTGA